MPQRDLYHDVVRRALIKDGWTITDDPFALEYKGMWVYADLGAERPLAAEKAGRKIVVEIKMFGAPSLMTELQKALTVRRLPHLFERFQPRTGTLSRCGDGCLSGFLAATRHSGRVGRSSRSSGGI